MPEHPLLTVPEVTPRPGGFAFSWADTDLHLRIERVREHHDSISAEFWCEQGETREHLYGGIRFSLTTPTGRGQVAKALQARRNGVDWAGMLEQVCVYAVRKFREQEGFMEIGNLPGVDTELAYRLKPLALDGVNTLLFGYGGMAKSTLSLAAGLIISQGEERLGLEPLSGPVLALDWETNWKLYQRMARMLQTGLGFPGVPHIFYRRCRRPFLEFAEEVKALVEKEGIVATIVDSAIKACGGEKEAKENASPVLDALSWACPTNWIISHRAKGEDAQERGAYGSVVFVNDCRQAWRVEGRESPDGIDVVLYDHKRNLTQIAQPLPFHLSFSPDSIVIERGNAGTIERVVERYSLRNAILNLLRNRPLPVKLILDQLGHQKATQIRSRLTELKNAGTLSLTPNGLWSLAPGEKT